MSKARDLADTVSTGGILDDGTVSVSEISDLTVTAAELNNVAGVNSDVQTQLDLKAPLASPSFTGNVGVGTGSPSEQLSVLGNVNIGNNDSSNPASYLRFGATQYGAADIRPVDAGGHKAGLDFYTDNTGDTTINPTFAMRIDSSGDVGIGTESPSVPLDVQANASGNALTLRGRNAAENAGWMAWTNYGGTVQAGMYATSDNLIMATGSSFTERFRIGSSGELGIGGATYGTAGQVLTSGGSGAAPTWADAAGGGTVELTASENITAGDVVVLNSSGQSSKVGYSADSDTVSEETLSVSSLTSNWSHGAWDQDQNKLLMVHSPSGYSKAVVGTPSGYSLSFGSEVSIFGDPDVAQHVVRYDTNYNQFIGAHVCGADNSGKYFVGTISGTSFVVDTSNSNFEGSEVAHLDMTIDQANAKVFIVYRHTNNSSKGTILCGTINDGSVSWGSGHVFQSTADTEGPSVNWNSTIGYVFVASKWGNGNAQQYYCATVSGTSFTDRFMYNEGSNCSSSKTVNDTANSTSSVGIHHVVRTGSGGAYIQAVEIDTNYSITTRGWQNFTTTGIGFGSSGDFDFWYDDVTDLMYLVTRQSGERMWIFKYNPSNYTYDVTSFGDFNTTAIGSGSRLSIAQDTTNGTIYIPHQGPSSTTPSYALSVQALSVSDASSFLGISEDTVTSGNTHNVTVISGVNENVSGLTPGARYYVGGDGSLQTTDNGNKIGKALASNKLYIDSAGA